MTAADRHAATWNGSSLLGETLRNLAVAVDAREKQDCESGGADETGGIC